MITAFSWVLNSSNALVEAVKCSGWRRTNKQFTVFTNYLSSVNFLLFFYFALSTESGQRSYNHGQKSWDIFSFLGVFPIHTCPTLPLPSSHKHYWTRAYIIFSDFQLYIRWGGGGRENCKKVLKRMHCVMREITENNEYYTVSRTFVHDYS